MQAQAEPTTKQPEEQLRRAIAASRTFAPEAFEIDFYETVDQRLQKNCGFYVGMNTDRSGFELKLPFS